MRLLPATALALLLVACASGYRYTPPPGVSDATLEADRRACVEESGIVRLAEDQTALEQQCMMQRGYRLVTGS